MSHQLPMRYKTISTWYRVYCCGLKAWVFRRIGCAALAEDISHDTYVRVMQRNEPINSSLSEVNEPKAYLRTIAHGIMVDFFRKQSLEAAYLESLQSNDVDHASPELNLQLVQALTLVDNVLQALPFEHRQAYVLFQFHRRPYVEIAQSMNISERTAKRYVKAALTEILLKATA